MKRKVLADQQRITGKGDGELHSGKMRKTTKAIDNNRQPLSTRPQRGNGPKTRFGFVIPPAGAENPAAAIESTLQPAVAKPLKAHTIKGAGVVIPRRRIAAEKNGIESNSAAGAAAGTTKAGELVPVEEEEVYQQQREQEEMISAIEELASHAFGEEEERTKVESLARGKLTLSNKWDYKEKIAKRDDVIRALRQGFAGLLTHKEEFVQAAVEIEMKLRTELRTARIAQALVADLKARNRTVEGQVEALRAECESALKQAATQAEAAETKDLEMERLKSNLDESQSALEKSKNDAAAAEFAKAEVAGAMERQLAETRAVNEGLSGELSETKIALEGVRVERDDLKEMKTALEIEVAEFSGTLKEVQGRSAVEAKERERLEAESVRLGEELKQLRETLAVRQDELAQTRLEAERRLSEVQQELIGKEAMRRESEVARSAAEAETMALKTKLEDTQKILEDKNKELFMALKSFADMQLSAQEREGELRQAGKDGEERVLRAEAKVSDLEGEMSRLRTEMAASIGEGTALKVELASKREEAKAHLSAAQEAQAALQELRASLAVEKELRSRAEGKEAEEREERVAANAQLLAMQQAHGTEMENQRAEKMEAVKEWERRAQDGEQERERLLRENRDAQEAALTLESELKTLRRALEDAESRTEQLQELAQISGEAEVLRRRLLEADRDREMGAEKYRQQVSDLEKAVQEGELQRRKMHNLIQELRGNVRVYARVRPFLPSDQVDASAQHCINVSAHDDSLAILKKDGSSDGNVLESHGFTFDRCFPPSAGQEVIFAEVSEFVQSALDGYNVCLFSYGQTGSGKTHTMQGFGSGPMKGIIPRAMEQVGRYKKMLEAQGWVYEMEVSFIEIYQEQIRDLLRSLATPNGGAGEESTSTTHDIKKDGKGNMFVTDVAMILLDPNDPQAVQRIMDVAGRHRSVGATSMNERSSRSHSVFTLHMRASNKERRSQLSGKLNLCDLAGSERLSRSNATGERLKETQAINKSLSALTDVFVAIANKQAHVPYRNSKLTYLLQQCLSGDGKTLMMINLSPTEQSYFESLCTLRFASQVNKCELGQARRNLHMVGQDGSSFASAGGPGATTSTLSRASTLTSATASSSSRLAKR
ncbi:dna topoisomerase [Nannochloropsis gaditana]|uniref:Dna topoisomerase n=4 Tax=Nannochloropsis gaditana TaxID=72520 RepID=W7TJI9_9STRA|nr:dna topoisomerase [Nannochloropsis gaditana]